MTKLVIGLYESSSKANDSIEMLKDEGISSSDIELIEYSDKKEEHGFFKSLFNTGGGKDLSPKDLREMGIPPRDAEFYNNAVKEGLSLLIVQCDDEDGRATEALLNKTHLHTDYGLPPSQREGSEKKTSRGEASPEFSSSSDFSKQGSSQHSDRGNSKFSGSSKESQKFEEVEEELHVGKREVETGGVRVSSKIREEEVEEEIELKEEHINIEHRDVDRPVKASESAFTEETLEFTETREEPMIEKEARVTGEVVITKEVDRSTEEIRETLRHKELDVEDLYSLAGKESGRFEQYEPHFRSHYNENYAVGADFDDDQFDEYTTGYRYGMALAEHEPLRNMSWEQVEPNAREGWEAHNAGTWNMYRDAVHYGWLRIRGEEESREQTRDI